MPLKVFGGGWVDRGPWPRHGNAIYGAQNEAVVEVDGQIR